MKRLLPILLTAVLLTGCDKPEVAVTPVAKTNESKYVVEEEANVVDISTLIDKEFVLNSEDCYMSVKDEVTVVVYNNKVSIYMMGTKLIYNNKTGEVYATNGDVGVMSIVEPNTEAVEELTSPVPIIVRSITDFNKNEITGKYTANADLEIDGIMYNASILLSEDTNTLLHATLKKDGNTVEIGLASLVCNDDYFAIDSVNYVSVPKDEIRDFISMYMLSGIFNEMAN